MIKNITLFLLCLFLSTIMMGQTQLQGKVIEEASGEPVLFGTVAMYKEGVLLTGTETDFDGNYFFSDIDPGTYDVEVTYVGLQTQRITGVVCKAGKVTPLNFNMKEEGILMDQVEIVGYKVPLIEFDNTTSGTTLTSENIQALPTKNISSIAATSAGVSVNQDGNISIRGSRTDATFYYIDGIRVSAENAGNMIPQAQIEQLQVITGGIEAAYGDVTGGVISITSKGPSSKFTGGIEAETSEFLDAYGYNLINANLSGPIIRKTLEDGTKQSVLGFRVFGQYRHVQDDDPSAVGVYAASEDLIRRLEKDPIQLFDGAPFPAAQFLTREDIPLTKVRPNEQDRDFNLGLNLDAKLSNSMNLTFSGAFYESKNRFTPGTINNRRVGTFNWVNNPFDVRDGYRGSLRFRHKIGRQSVDMDDEDKNSLIRNASYSIQFGYEKINRLREDVRHEDNFFRYGYFGESEVDYRYNLSEVTDPNWSHPVVFIAGRPFAFQGISEVAGEFTPDPNVNPVLAYQYDDGQYYNDLNGFREQAQRNIFSMFENVGNVYNLYSKQEEDRYTLNVNSGFDLFPGGSESGKHSIQFGFMYEQRVQRSFSIQPTAIWQLMRSTINRHISNGIDTTNIVGDSTVVIGGIPTTLFLFGANDQTNEFEQNLFFRAIRDKLGVGLTEFLNIDGVSPDDLSLDMFAPGDLLAEEALRLDYYGYDYTGNKLSGTTSFDDFFTGVDENGRRTFNVAPFQPNYIAGYIQDKFTYKDIIFRLGLRVDYYDANTKVLKDPFALSDIESAAQFFSREENRDIPRPGSIPDDYKVYVGSEGSSDVIGYRRGNEWFDKNGTAIDPSLLFVSGQVFPSYVEKNDLKRNPQYYETTQDGTIERFDPTDAFQDYDPQLNFMPRLAFSFPISESAGFFAHYDVLVQRPQSTAVIYTPLNYYNYFNANLFSTATNPANNPDLKPQKTIDYEVGFQQKVSNSSAIKLSLYYRELRDMIQRRVFNFVPRIGQYETYDNLDFGTVKGFSFAYDLRRTKNFQLNATYTLQLARGTGSDLNSSRGLNNQQQIRVLLPLSYDERHRFTAVADYRFSSGTKYNGPRVAGQDILADMGFNLLMTTVSGRPYSSFQDVNGPVTSTITESINKTRLPWQFNADFQVDKNFSIGFSEESTRKLNVNVYLRITNLFDLDNVVRVYNVTDSPEDSGWLSSNQGVQTRNLFLDLGFAGENYDAAFAWRTLQPNFYARPRQIFLGAIANF